MKVSPLFRAISLLLAALFLLPLHVIAAFDEKEKSSDSPAYYLTQYIQQTQTTTKPERKEGRTQSRESQTSQPANPSPGQKTGPKGAQQNDNEPIEVVIEADEQHKDGDVTIATGYVVLIYGMSRLQADKVIYNSVTGDANAEGNVIYDSDPQQRITAQTAVLNVVTRKGTFYHATGFTDQTSDGATLNFTAERAEKTGLDSYILYGAYITACEQARPAWNFEGSKADIHINKSASIDNSIFRFKGIPIFYLPAISLPIGHRERKSGFLIPTTGTSTVEGQFISDAYFQTLGRSADLLIDGDIYTSRGVGIGAIFRVRPDELSFLRLGSFTVFDGLFGNHNQSDQNNLGGTLFFAKGLQYLPHGFFAGVNVDFTTSLAFQRTFGNGLEQIFNPEKRSQIYLQNNFSVGTGNYTFTALAETKNDRIFNTLLTNVSNSDLTPASHLNITVHHLPSFELSGYSQQIANLPLYLSFDSSLDGLYRRDRLNQVVDFITPSITQRFDMQPKVLLDLPDLAGWSIKPELSLRSTFYSNSLVPNNLLPSTPSTNPAGTVIGENIFRKYLEFAVDIRPPSFARTFDNKNGKPRLKHIIEPFMTYRNISGVNDAARIIRFDERDAIADTSQIEYGVTNRFFVPIKDNAGNISSHEILNVSLSQIYFFDPTFGGAFRPGLRNQFYPIDTLSGFSFDGLMHRFAPLDLRVRYRPISPFSADFHMDYDTQENKLRNISIDAALTKKLFSFTERFYHSSTLQIAPGLLEPGNFPGDLLVSTFTFGNERHGYFGGGGLTYDFKDQFDPSTGLRVNAGVRRASTYIGYACDCGTLEFNYTISNVGSFRENRFTFSFILAGVGTFGTERTRQ
jgi:LPS-assembly protein